MFEIDKIKYYILNKISSILRYFYYFSIDIINLPHILIIYTVNLNTFYNSFKQMYLTVFYSLLVERKITRFTTNLNHILYNELKYEIMLYILSHILTFFIHKFAYFFI